MCVIIFKPAKEVIIKRDLLTAYENNPDGCGIADITAGKCVKGLWTAKQLWRAYRERADHDLIIHLRIATSGKVDAAACHPFLLKNGGCLAHNGVISGLTDRDSDLSDTQMLVAMLESCRSVDLQLQILRSHSGSNRFAFLDRKGRLHLLGSWSKRGGLSVSNQHSFAAAKHVATWNTGTQTSLAPACVTREAKGYESQSIADYYRSHRDLWDD